MNEQQHRFIKLNGDPVHMNSLYAKLYDPAVRTLCVTALFNAAAAGQGDRDKMILALAGTALGAVLGFMAGNVLTTVGPRRFLGKEFDMLCIDKYPDQNTPPTSAKHLDLARRCRDGNLFMGLSTGVKSVLFPLIGFVVFNKEPPPTILMMICAMISMNTTAAARFLTNFSRFNKVCEHEWEIVNTPAPEKKKEDLKVPNALPQPT